MKQYLAFRINFTSLLVLYKIILILFISFLFYRVKKCSKKLKRVIGLFLRHRDILQGKVSQGKFSDWIRGRRGGGGFFPMGTIN